ncbi:MULTISPECIES: MarR family winged helix-turn-helix transcriptional regulator [Cupriavidus]
MSTTTIETFITDPVRAELDVLQASTPLFKRPGFLIRRMHQIHGFLFAEEAGEFNITPVQYSLLTTLDALGEIDQNTLAIEIGLERSSVAEVIPRLHARGLVDRAQATHDRRQRLVKLTTQGKRLLKKMAPAVQRAHDRTIDHLSPAERDIFMLLMIRLVKANNADHVVPLRLPQD